jgi:hypothetical protein
MAMRFRKKDIYSASRSLLLAGASAALVFVVVSPVSAQDADTKEVLKPAVQTANDEAAAPEAQKADSQSSQSRDMQGPQRSEADKNADLAFGAFQRGYYLTALELALPRARLGDPAAQTLIAELYARGLGVPLDAGEAVSWYKLAAQAGDAAAQFALGMYYLDGVEVEKDTTRAQELLTKAANKGNMLAQFNLAQLIISDRPTSAGYGEALGWFRKASEAGNIEASYSAAQIILRGLDGLGPRPVDAQPLLEDAARGGVVPAQVELGILLANGLPGASDEEVAQQQTQAFKWLRRAAFTANPVAQNRVARLRMAGIGTEKDLIEAAKWHILSRRAGLADTELDRMFARLSQDDRAQALILANAWPNLPGRDPFSQDGEVEPIAPVQNGGQLNDLAGVQAPKNADLLVEPDQPELPVPPQ